MMVSGPGQKTARQDEEPGGQLTGQFLGHQGVADEDGQRAVGFAPLGLKDAGDGAQVERVGHQKVEGVGGESPPPGRGAPRRRRVPALRVADPGDRFRPGRLPS